MTARRVLLVAYNFPPNAAIGTMRTLRLVEQLVAEGWDVKVLTADPRSYRDGEPVDQALCRRVGASVEVVNARVWRPVERVTQLLRGVMTRPPSAGAVPSPVTANAPPARTARGLARKVIDVVDVVSSIPDQESGWILPAVWRGVRLSWRWRPDLVYSTAPCWSAQLIGLALSRLLRARWVADFRDPWARAPWRDDQPALIKASWHRCERRVVRQADAIVFNTRRARDEFAGFYGAALRSKFHLVPNGCDIGDFDGPAPGAEDAFVLLHAGSLYGARSPVALLQAIRAACDRGAIAPDRFRLRLLGTSADATLRATISALGLEDVVQVRPRVSRRESIREIRAASALLLLQQGHAFSVPAKTYEYLASGRPILAVTGEGETARVIADSGTGVVVETGDAEALEQGLLRVMAMARAGVAPPAPASYDGAERARELAALLASVADDHPDAVHLAVAGRRERHGA